MQPGYTDATVVLDRSGGMRDIRDDMEGGWPGSRRSRAAAW